MRALRFCARGVLWVLAGSFWVLAAAGNALMASVMLFSWAGKTETAEASVQFMFAALLTAVFVAPAGAITDYLTGGRFWPYVFPKSKTSP